MIDTNIQGHQTMVSAHGVDIVDINDFERLLQEPSVNYLDLYFSNDEILAAGSGVTRAQRLAGKFAVKEAVMKALGTGWGNGVNFRDVEVITVLSGEPKILLHRKLASIMQEKAVTSWLVSISHTSTLAMASVIGIRERS